jgi:hypothetical protein
MSSITMNKPELYLEKFTHDTSSTLSGTQSCPEAQELATQQGIHFDHEQRLPDRLSHPRRCTVWSHQLQSQCGSGSLEDMFGHQQASRCPFGQSSCSTGSSLQANRGARRETHVLESFQERGPPDRLRFPVPPEDVLAHKHAARPSEERRVLLRPSVIHRCVRVIHHGVDG